MLIHSTLTEVVLGCCKVSRPYIGAENHKVVSINDPNTITSSSINLQSTVEL